MFNMLTGARSDDAAVSLLRRTSQVLAMRDAAPEQRLQIQLQPLRVNVGMRIFGPAVGQLGGQ